MDPGASRSRPASPTAPAQMVPIELQDNANGRGIVQTGNGHAQEHPYSSESSAGTGPESEGGEHFQPKSLRFWLTLFCNFLALFLVAIDRTIIATAVPRISDEFQALGDIGWYGSSYMLTTACAQLLFGRIYKFYDMKWTFLLSIVVFEIGSVICGAAPNSNTFIAGRAVAGLGSAGIFSGCLLIMIPLVPLNHRPLFQGIFGGVFGLASVMGPLVGGGFTGQVTWRWCFYINLPIGGVVLILMYLCWNSPKKHHDLVNPADHINRLNPLGMIFLLPGIVCLFLAFQWGGSTYQWNEWRIVLLLVLFGLCTTAFIAVQILRPENATVPPKVITQRSVACATSFTFFLAGSMLMLVYYMPIWFQTVKAVDPMRSGINTLPLVLSLVISSIISGVVTHRIGYYVPSMYVGPALMSIGEGLLSTLDRSSPTSHWVSYQFISGFGLGCGMQTGSLAVQKVLPPDDVSTGVAIINFAQQLGGAVFTSVGQTILTNILVSELSHLPGFDPKLLVSEGATQIVQRVGPENADLVINAYNTAIRHTFQTSMGLAFASFLCAFGMEWKTVKKGKKEPGPPGPLHTLNPPNDETQNGLTSPPPEISDPENATGPEPGKPFFETATRHKKKTPRPSLLRPIPSDEPPHTTDTPRDPRFPATPPRRPSITIDGVSDELAYALQDYLRYAGYPSTKSQEAEGKKGDKK